MAKDTSAPRIHFHSEKSGQIITTPAPKHATSQAPPIPTCLFSCGATAEAFLDMTSALSIPTNPDAQCMAYLPTPPKFNIALEK